MVWQKCVGGEIKKWGNTQNSHFSGNKSPAKYTNYTVMQFNLFIPVAVKIAWRLWWYLFNKSIIRKIFNKEMLFWTQPTIPLQYIYEFTITSEVIFIRIIGP